MLRQNAHVLQTVIRVGVLMYPMSPIKGKQPQYSRNVARKLKIVKFDMDRVVINFPCLNPSSTAVTINIYIMWQLKRPELYARKG